MPTPQRLLTNDKDERPDRPSMRRPPLGGDPVQKREAAALDMAETHHRLIGVIGDLHAVLDKMAPKVIGVQTVVLDANGTAAGQYRLPFQAVAVDSFSAHELTVASSPLQTSAPNAGPGLALVRPGGFAVVNLRAYQWSIYGGTLGERVVVTAYANPQVPSANSSPFAAQQSAYNSGSATAPGAGTILAQLPVLPAGWYSLRVFAGFGTAETNTPSNLALYLGTTLLESNLQAPVANNQRFEVGSFLARSDGVNFFNVKNPVASSAGAFYQVSLQADPNGLV